MIVTIDGPAGAGKSTVAKQLADELSFAFLDTGAMYRTVALAGLRANVDWEQPQQLTDLAKDLDINQQAKLTFLNDEDVSAKIRTVNVTEYTKYAAVNPGIRAHLVSLQQKIGSDKDIVTEGRDQGTVAFPHAECKIFLTATPEARAKRRVEQLEQSGETADYEMILAQQNARDKQDSSREVGPLKKAEDAIEVLTDGKSLAEVVQELVAIVNEKRSS